MDLHSISIGQAPDFTLKSGQMIHHHKVILEISLKEKRTYKITRDAVSMHRLIREVKMVLQVIGWVPASEIKWAGKIDYIGSVTTKSGSVKIKYALPATILEVHKHRLNAMFSLGFSAATGAD